MEASSMNMNISSPTPTKKEALVAMFASPTGVIDEARTNFSQKTINILAPNLDAPSSPIAPPSPPPRDEFITNLGLLSLPPLLGSLQDDEDEGQADNGPTTKVADTFDDKERLRQVKFCPWKQQKCSREFRERAFKLEKDEAVTFKNRHDVNRRVQHQQEEEFNARRIKIFTERAYNKQREEARDFKNLANIRRQLHNLDNNGSNSSRSMMIRKRLFDEAMAD